MTQICFYNKGEKQVIIRMRCRFKIACKKGTSEETGDSGKMEGLSLKADIK